MPDDVLQEVPRTGGNLLNVEAFSKASPAMADAGSKQLIEDPFRYDQNGLTPPPYSMEQLVLLAEQHPTHSSALEQKAVDIIGSGVTWTPIDENEEESNPEERTKLEQWWTDLADGSEMVEILFALALDFVTLDWAFLEVSRKANGGVAHLYHVPAHTIRAHRDGIRFAQLRSGKTVWFKRWGVVPDFYASSGNPVEAHMAEDADNALLANELLVFRRPSRRSTWYGIPSYISAVGHIALAIAARDYNVLFFNNAREPRHLFMITGLEEDVNNTMSEMLEEMKQGLKEPHRNLIVPFTGGANMTIQSLGQQMNDAHFQKLADMTDKEILMAHRIPGDRIGHPARGPLGGSAALITNRIYKDGVIEKAQGIFEHRINRFVQTEFPSNSKGKKPKAVGSKPPGAVETFVVERSDYKLAWKANLTELDITDEQLDVSTTMQLVKDDAITINEGRSRLDLKPLMKFRKNIDEMCREVETKEMARERMRESMAHPQPPPAPPQIGPKPAKKLTPEEMASINGPPRRQPPQQAPPQGVTKAEPLTGQQAAPGQTDQSPKQPDQSPKQPDQSPKQGDDLVSDEQKARVKKLVEEKRKACEDDPTELDMTLTEYRKSIGGQQGGGAPGPGTPPPPGAPGGPQQEHFPASTKPVMKSLEDDYGLQLNVLERLEDMDDLISVFLEDEVQV